MTIPTTVKAEYLRAIAAEKTLADRLTALEQPPTPAPAPVPTPAPAPYAVRVAPPVTVRTVTLPSSVDTTGATDASPALTTFFASVQGGTLVSFPDTGALTLGATRDWADPSDEGPAE